MKTPSAITASFIVSMIASLGLLALYVLGGGAQLEGVLLGFALGGLGLGLAIWATSYMNVPEEVEERHLMSEPEPGAEDDDTSPLAGMEDLSRRKVLLRLLAGAGGTLAGALAIPAFSLGPNPGDDLFRSGWSAGDRLVNLEGRPVRPADIPVEGIETVFPEGKVGLSDAQTVLIKVDPGALSLPEGRGEWAPQGCLGYSKICTHVGCSVGLYRSAAQQLLCPCHQSTFDVLTGATPVFGPAARPLPQLPLDIDDEGYLIATGEFSAPVGPAFWNVDRGS
ncbi:MAG: Rieske 2Fe-2S domain-containing protein [Actinomycetota bacterium]|nr:Rieske 2Fe-2S domain-containing protein [Actinomycetota bacterium]